MTTPDGDAKAIEPIQFTAANGERVELRCSGEEGRPWLATPADLAAAGYVAMTANQNHWHQEALNRARELEAARGELEHMRLGRDRDITALQGHLTTERARAEEAERELKRVTMDMNGRLAVVRRQRNEAMAEAKQERELADQHLSAYVDRDAQLAAANARMGRLEEERRRLLDAFVRRECNDLTVEEFDGMFHEMLTPGQGMGVAVFKQNASALSAAPQASTDSSPQGQKAGNEHDRGHNDRSAATEQREAGDHGLERGEADSPRDDRRAEGSAEEPRASAGHHQAGGSATLGRRSDDDGVKPIQFARQSLAKGEIAEAVEWLADHLEWLSKRTSPQASTSLKPYCRSCRSTDPRVAYMSCADPFHAPQASTEQPDAGTRAAEARQRIELEAMDQASAEPFAELRCPDCSTVFPRGAIRENASCPGCGLRFGTPQASTGQVEAPVCARCNDTHRVDSERGQQMCTACPVPCEKCRTRGPGGAGAYCKEPRCGCLCHAKAAQSSPIPQVAQESGGPPAWFARALTEAQQKDLAARPAQPKPPSPWADNPEVCSDCNHSSQSHAGVSSCFECNCNRFVYRQPKPPEPLSVEGNKRLSQRDPFWGLDSVKRGLRGLRDYTPADQTLCLAIYDLRDAVEFLLLRNQEAVTVRDKRVADELEKGVK